MYEVTNRVIKSVRISEKNVKFNIILLESNKETNFTYENVDVYIRPEEEFNYNKYLNIANEYLTSDWVLITNNDVIYQREWFSKILEIYNKRPDIESFSPKEVLFYSTIYGDHFDSEDDYFESYRVTESVMGWSLVMRKRVWDEIYPWDENFDFYYQDNDYAKTIESKGIKHAVVRDSLTLHIGNINFFKSNVDEDRDKKMEEDYYKFIKKWNN
jgi:GT2 family glycosyltransferase